MEEKQIKGERRWQKQEESIQWIKAIALFDFKVCPKVELTIEEVVKRGK